jgi:pimeloyl-ACP methyl ester carboxylesterase
MNSPVNGVLAPRRETEMEVRQVSDPEALELRGQAGQRHVERSQPNPSGLELPPSRRGKAGRTKYGERFPHSDCILVPAFTTADGRTLTFKQVGDGPPLVCHPGGPGLSVLFFGDFAALESDLSLILLSPRGVDDSDPADSYRLEDYAADLDELRAHLELDRMDLFGHSAGGFTSIVYAATYPEHVGKLVLCGSFARFTDEFRAAFGRLLAQREQDPRFADAVAARRERDENPALGDDEFGRLALQSLPLLFGRFGADEAAFLHSAIAAGGSYHLPALEQFNSEIEATMALRPELGRIDAPTLVLTGDLDVWGARAADELVAHLRKGHVHVLPGVGHMPWIEDPGSFRRAMLEFLG